MAENSIGWVLTKERLPEKDGEYFCITRIPQNKCTVIKTRIIVDYVQISE